MTTNQTKSRPRKRSAKAAQGAVRTWVGWELASLAAKAIEASR